MCPRRMTIRLDARLPARLKLPTRIAGPRRGLRAVSRTVARDRTPRAIPIRHCSRWGLPCRSGCPSRGELLPHRFTLAQSARQGRSGWAVCSLWRFPSGCPGRGLPGTVVLWSPDFPRHPLRGVAAIRPSARQST